MQSIVKHARIGLVALSFAGLTGFAIASGSGSARSVAHAGVDGQAAYEVDAVHSAVIFRVKHNEAAFNYGRFNELSGTVDFDEANGLSGVALTVNAGSVDTANKDRDNHLRSPDFFNAKQFPEVTFKSTSVKKAGEHAYEVTGDFTLMGVTKPLTVTVNHTGNGKTMRGTAVAGFEAEFTITRSEFGMTKYLPAVGDEVTLIVGIEAVKQ